MTEEKRMLRYSVILKEESKTEFPLPTTFYYKCKTKEFRRLR
jgi:hypothetical protein